MECKSFFPRTQWMIDKSIIACQGFLRKRGLPASGKKNLEGSLFGPRNEPMLNGTMPAMLAGCPGLNFNSDLQIPYRFPVTKETHCDELCEYECWQHVDEAKMVLTAQSLQNAQAGYAADYQCKRCAQCFNEVKEIKKGHHALAEKISDKRISYIGHRHVTRICSDYYNKGCVRSNQESTNLRAYADHRDVTAAESIKTSQTALFPGAQAMQMIEKFFPDEFSATSTNVGVRMEFTYKPTGHSSITTKNLVFLYCMRPMNSKYAPELPFLSLYEFLRYWRVEPPAFVSDVGELEHEDSISYQAILSLSGVKKLEQREVDAGVQFIPGEDYRIKEEG
eukprot:12282579-Karenia_brevis.AAC.1